MEFARAYSGDRVIIPLLGSGALHHSKVAYWAHLPQAALEYSRTVGLFKNDREKVEALLEEHERKDPLTVHHQEQVASLAALIAERLGLGDVLTRECWEGGRIHDIGKMGIEATRSTQSLNVAEIRKIQVAHVRLGAAILAVMDLRIPHLWLIVNEHHEMLNGKGYPRGLKGEEIDLRAGIVSVADFLQSRTSRKDRGMTSLDRAFAMVQNQAGRKFAGSVVEACEEVIKEGFQFEEFKPDSKI